MTIFVDTSVWSLLLRRDRPPEVAEVRALELALGAGAPVVSTGLILQELLQGITGPKDRALLASRFSAILLVVPDREDHVEAALLHTRCRKHGVQVGTIDALFARLCLRHDLTMLTTDRDFAHMARHCPLRLWDA